MNWRKFAVAASALVVAALVLAAALPVNYRVVREADIAATPEAVVAQLTEFPRLEKWRKAALDPTFRLSLDGSWTSSTGTGRLSVQRAGNAIAFEIERGSAKEVHQILLAPHGTATHLTWSVNLVRSYADRLVSLAMNTEQMQSRIIDANVRAIAAACAASSPN